MRVRFKESPGIGKLLNALDRSNSEVILTFGADVQIVPQVSRVQQLAALEAIRPERADVIRRRDRLWLLAFFVITAFAPLVKPVF